jgi:hypothetical protein
LRAARPQGSEAAADRTPKCAGIVPGVRSVPASRSRPVTRPSHFIYRNVIRNSGSVNKNFIIWVSSDIIATIWQYLLYVGCVPFRIKAARISRPVDDRPCVMLRSWGMERFQRDCLPGAMRPGTGCRWRTTTSQPDPSAGMQENRVGFAIARPRASIRFAHECVKRGRNGDSRARFQESSMTHRARADLPRPSGPRLRPHGADGSRARFP